MQMHGLKHEAKDIDIVVKNLDYLDKFGKINYFKSVSKFSKSGKRANIIISDEIIIDIFVENDSPDFKIIEGLKCETLFSLKNHFEELQKIITDKYWLDIIKVKLNKLK